MHRNFRLIAILGATVALSSPASAQYSLGDAPAPAGGQPAYDWQLPSNAGQTGIYNPGTLNTGQRFRWAPTLGHTGQVLGPVVPNAYGLGIGMDAAGKPVKAVAK